MRSLEDMDAEIAALDANLRRLREQRVADLLELATDEPNSELREYLVREAERMRLLVAQTRKP